MSRAANELYNALRETYPELPSRVRSFNVTGSVDEPVMITVEVVCTSTGGVLGELKRYTLTEVPDGQG